MNLETFANTPIKELVADLSWFDQQDLAETIAQCPLPVVTAIGHEIDRSIADLVAFHSCKTPTAAATWRETPTPSPTGEMLTATMAIVLLLVLREMIAFPPLHSGSLSDGALGSARNHTARRRTAERSRTRAARVSIRCCNTG